MTLDDPEFDSELSRRIDSMHIVFEAATTRQLVQFREHIDELLGPDPRPVVWATYHDDDGCAAIRWSPDVPTARFYRGRLFAGLMEGTIARVRCAACGQKL